MNNNIIIISILAFLTLYLLTACSGASGSTAPTQTASAQAQANLQTTQVTDNPGSTQTPGESVPQVVSHNADWKPEIRSFHGVDMAFVPAGCFDMGSDNESSDEQPVHQQCFSQPLWIDRYEVTNAQFAAFNGQAANVSPFTGPNQPRGSVTWSEAQAFCALRGARLPTEAEWEYAARGPDDLVYPWGNDFLADNAVYTDNSNNQPQNVGSKPGGASWVGSLDLSGNITEWVNSLYSPYPYHATDGRENPGGGSVRRAVRGGTWSDFSSSISAARRDSFPATSQAEFLGFRCAGDDLLTEAQTTQTASSEPGQTSAPSVSGPVAHNADWSPVVQTFDGVDLALVPPGCFYLGNDPGSGYLDASGHFVNGVPDGGQICFDAPFWIDRYEVTNAQFAAFNGVAANASHLTGPNQPRDSVTWVEARDFCALRGARLPTEAEWEYVARGPDDLFYPWGGDFAADNVVYSANSNHQSADVGSRPSGISWVGALDMSGNIKEWVSSIYRPYPYNAEDGRENNRPYSE